MSDVFAFPNFRKVGKFAASIERPKANSTSASEGLRPLTPRPGAPVSLDPAGGSANRPARYRLALPRSPWGRVLQILQARTATGSKASSIFHDRSRRNAQSKELGSRSKPKNPRTSKSRFHNET